MPTLLTTATGNFTAAATWALCDATSLLDSEAGTTNISTTNLDSAAFTPGAITVDALAVKISALSTTTPTGTVTVTLRNSTLGSDVASVTLNAADLPLNGWCVVLLSSSQLLLAATNYLIRVVRSVADGATNRVTLFRDGTTNNHARLLRTTTTQAPAAADTLHIAGVHTGAGTGTDITVTMDNTATTSFGSSSTTIPSFTVGKRATLTLGTAASTNYYLRLAALFAIYSGGTVNFGTSGTPLDASSTFVLEWNCVAAGDFGLRVFDGGTLNMYGATKAAVWNYLTVDKAAAATTLTVVDTSGWAAGDELCIASTTRTYSQCEKKVIQTVDSGTTVTLTAGLTNAHSGTSPTQAEVGNLTRNIKLRGISVTLVGYLRFDAASVVTARYVEVYWNGTATANKYGLNFLTTSAGSADWQYGTVHDCTVTGMVAVLCGGASGSVTYSNNVLYNCYGVFLLIQATSGVHVIEDNLCMLYVGGTSPLLFCQDMGSTYRRNHCVGGNRGINLQEQATVGIWDGNVVHSCSSIGIAVSGGGVFVSPAVLSNGTVWRCNSFGLVFETRMMNLTLQGWTFFGNQTSNVDFGSVSVHDNICFDTCTLSSNVSPNDTVYGIGAQNAGILCELRNCSFGVASGIFTAHTGGDLGPASTTYLTQVRAVNTRMASGTEVYLGANLGGSPQSYITSENHDQVPGAFRNWYRYGIVQSDTVIFSTAAPSLRLTPNSATSPLSYKVCTAAIATGTTATVSVKVRCSVSGDGAAYNGGFPRLIVKRNDSIGLSADTVLATATSASSGAWEVLTGTTPTVSGHGILEYIVDCTGTTGFVSCDEVTPPTAVDTTGFAYGLNGERGALVGTVGGAATGSRRARGCY